jgi:hypothetical protein
MKTVWSAAFALTVVATAFGATQASAQQQFEYAVKFVCGKAAPPNGVAAGFYFTLINVHNPGTVTVEFRKKFARAMPNQKPDKITQLFGAVLKADEVFGVECMEITQRLGLAPGSFVDGVAVFITPRELDVIAVYTASATQTGPLVTLHTERVPKRP